MEQLFGRKFSAVGALLSFIFSFYVESTAAAVDCSTFLRCDECLRADPSCMWCDDQNALQAIARNQNTTQGARLCGNSARMAALGCGNVVDPSSTVQTETSSGRQSVSISTATVNLRPGKPATVSISVSPPQSAAVDMYLLIDVTQSMGPYVSALQSIAANLITRMSNITSEFRVGMGTFVDKNLPPFSDPLLSSQCLIGGFNCAMSYDFHHEVSLTSNSTEFEAAVVGIELSGGLDPAEAILDALLQSAVCEDIIGWRPRQESQRIVLALTEDEYHYGLDARIAGISKPPTAKCEIDPATGMYSVAESVEYPSAAFIGEVLSDNLITPIFGAASGPRQLYFELSRIIGSARVADLSPNPNDLLDFIVGQVQQISGTVIPTVRIPDDVKDILSVSVAPVDNCSPGSVDPNITTACINIEYPNSATFEFTIDGTQALCDYGPVTIDVQFIRFGSASVEVTPICSCDCSSQSVENSDVCSNFGTLECSTCVCNELRQGAVCQCPVVRGVTSTGCIESGTDQVCSGRGSCNCGRCDCDMNVAGNQYDGDYCQFDPDNCPSGLDANNEQRPCSGNGECANVLCICGSGFSGRSCDCTNDNSTCIDPSGDPSKLCSGEGQCVCGQCVCNDYSLNIGDYCQDCLPCRTSCSRVSPCVLCSIIEDMECQANLTCESRLKIEDAESLTSTQGMKVCSIREGSCEVRYFLNQRIRGDESDITVFMDLTQSSIEVLRTGSTVCQRGALVWPIIVGIIGGTIILGIVIVVLWRGCAYLGEYLEFKQWERSIKNDTERTGENPLFVGATAEYQNPRYRRT